MTITREQLDEWTQLANEATPGPWETQGTSRDAGKAWGYYVASIRQLSPEQIDPDDDENGLMVDLVVRVEYQGNDQNKANSDFIASARTAIPSLIAALAEARAQRDEARNISDDWKSAAETGVTRISALTSAMEKARGVMGILKPTSLLAAALLADALAAINEAVKVEK